MTIHIRFLVGLALVSIQVDDEQLHDTNHNARNIWRLNTHNTANNSQSLLIFMTQFATGNT